MLAFDIDTEPLERALDVCAEEMQRIGAGAAESIHLSVFEEPSDETLHTRYCAISAGNGVLQMVPSYLLLKFITIMRRHGTA